MNTSILLVSCSLSVDMRDKSEVNKHLFHGISEVNDVFVFKQCEKFNTLAFQLNRFDYFQSSEVYGYHSPVGLNFSIYNDITDWPSIQ